MRPQISIITATRNAISHLPGLAESLLRHPGSLMEWVVIDGVSDDGTVEYLRGIDDPRLTWISEADTGIYDAWNKGVARARGDLLMFIGADDRVGEGWLEACGAAPPADLLYGDLEILDADGRPISRVTARPWGAIEPEMKSRMLLPHPGLAHNRRLFEGRRFDTSFKIAGDFHFLAGAGVRSAVRLPMVQASMRLGGVSNRPDRVAAAYRENRRVAREHGRDLPVRDRLHWGVKRTLAALAPTLFLRLQEASWRARREL
jgi:glycosyltransferase involved in cell wall biosynthesis